MSNIIPADHIVLTFPQRFIVKIDGREYPLSLSAVAAEHGTDHAGRVAAYLIQRGLDETLGNAWSTQAADARDHAKVAARLARIITDPSGRGRASDEVERETMILARKRLSASGLKADTLKGLNTPDKVKAEIARGLEASIPDPENRIRAVERVWSALSAKAAEIIAARSAPIAAPADAFADLLGDLGA